MRLFLIYYILWLLKEKRFFHILGIAVREIILVFALIALLSLSVEAATLKAHWEFEETSGNVLDSSGNNVTGTLSGGVTRGVEGAFAGSNAYDFSSTGFANFSDPGGQIQFTGSFSMAFWINAPSQTGTLQSLFNQNHEGAGVGGYASQAANNVNANDINLIVGLTGVGYPQVIANNVLDNDWHHIAFTIFDNGSTTVMSSYVDGVLDQQTGAIGGTVATKSPGFTLGRGCCNDGRFFTGKVDDFRIFSGVLEDSEVALLAGAVPESSSLVLLVMAMFAGICAGKRRL